GRDEQAAGVLDAVGRGAAQDGVLRDALASRDRVLDRVASAGMEEAVKAAGRPGGQVVALDENDRETAHGRVARDPGPGRAAGDDEHFRFERGHATGQYRSAMWGDRGGGRRVSRGPGGRVRRALGCCELVEPVEGPRDGLLPERVLLVALLRVHLRLPLLVLAP